MGSDEFTNWMAFERLEPFGALADESRAGTIAAAAYNAQRTARTDSYVQPSDLMPALKASLERANAARAPVVDTLDPDQHTALFDACIFGMTKQ